MTSSSDAAIQRQVSELLADAGITLDVSVTDGVVQLTGLVSSPRMRQAALDIARSISGVHRVDDEIEYEVISPDMITEPPDDDMQFDYADQQAFDDDVPDDEPSFSEPVESRDFQEVIEEGGVWFPPTDPVVEPSTDDQELRVVGGFQYSSMEDTEEETTEAFDEAFPTGSGDRVIERNDDDILDDVRRELGEDALTIDLDIDVSVVNGVVFLRGSVQTLEDAENAESVAARVPGVVEVQDMIEVAG